MSNKKYDIIFFGGNYAGHDGPMISFYNEAVTLGFDSFIITDPNHFNQKTKSKSLSNLLANHSIPHKILTKLSYKDIEKYMHSDTIGLSICSTWIFKKEIIDLFNGRLINYHNAKLPEERGAAGYSWKIMRKERFGELTLHQIVEEIDKGPVCKKMKINFTTNLNSLSDYYNFLEKYEKKFFKEFLEKYKNNKKLQFNQIDLSRSFYYPPLDTLTHGWIDWSWSGDEICRFINAFSSPFKGASTIIKGERVFLQNPSIIETDLNFHPFQSGIITRKDKNALFVICYDSLLKISFVEDQNGESLINQLKEGDRFYTTSKELDNAKSSKFLKNKNSIRKYDKNSDID